MVLASLFVLCSMSLAQEGKAPTEVSGVIYADYFYDSTDGVAPAKKSYFELTRLYITAARKLSDKIKIKATLEGAQPANSLFIKNAAVEFSDVFANQSIRAGVIGTPWIGYEEKIWRYRYVAKTFMDYASLLNSADIGVGLSGKLAGKLIDYDLNVINGEGYKGAEVSEHKDFAARISVEPCPRAKVHAYQQLGNTGTGEANRNRTLVGLSYEQEAYSAMAYYFAAKDLSTDKSGYSVFGSYDILEWLSILCRMDSIDLDTSSSNNSYNRIVAGLSTRVSDDVQLSLDYELKSFEDTDIQGNDQSKIFTHIGIKY